MTRIEFHEAAAGHDKYFPHAFDGVIGHQVPIRARPSGRKIGQCTVTGVRVDDDGGGATWTVDIEDWQPVNPRRSAEAAREGKPDEEALRLAYGSSLVAEIVRRDPVGLSMSFAAPDLPRDPLGSVGVRVLWAVPADGAALAGKDSADE